MNEHSDWLEHISRYADGTLDEAEVKALDSALRDDAALRREFMEYLNVDSALADQAALAECDAESSTVAEHSRQPAWPARTILAAVAASLLLAATASLLLRTGRGEQVDVAIEVLAAEQVEADGELRAVQAGDRLRVSALQSSRGTLRLRLASGVVLELQGPVEAAFDGPSRMRLVRGRMNADVGKAGKGFAVVTDAGEIIDLGTRFGVDVGPTGEASVAVFSGEVRVDAASGDREAHVTTLFEGEAVRLDAEHAPSRLASIPLRRTELVWDSAAVNRVVTDVSDNIPEADFRRFYGIITAGMAEGTLIYTDRPRVVWHAAEGEAFPPELIGADVVCPFHSDRHERILQMTITLAQPAAVYVMHDARKLPLEWLKQGFVDTGQRLRSGPWKPTPVVRTVQPNEAGEIFIEYTVWRKDVSRAGNVQLGPPHVTGEGGSKAMYGIAVVPIAEDPESEWTTL